MVKTHFLKVRPRWSSIRKFGFLFLLMLFTGRTLSFAEIHFPDNHELQQQRITVKGFVRDNHGEPLPGATVIVKGTTNASITSMDGNYSLTNVPMDAVLVYSFVGMVSMEIEVKSQTTIDVALQEDSKTLDDVVVVAFGKQKKESMISSIQAISPKDLKVPSSNLTTALAGRMSGVIAYQRSGEPGKDNADFFIRGVTTFGYKKDPLILIDGIESNTTELARMQPDDIAAFSILKDATATALYGARGANGVIQVATKEGKEGPLKMSVRLESSFSSNTQDVELADPITYMRMANEAERTRNSRPDIPYSEEKIDNTIAGKNPYIYPANDWRNQLMNDVTYNQRVNMNLSGGGGIGRYYIAASYSRDNGNLKMDKKNNYNNNISLQTYQLRTNVNLDLTKTTKATVRLSGSFDDYRGPLEGGEEMYKKIMRSNPVKFPAYYPGSLQPDTNHILFGNATRDGSGKSADYINPYAEMVKGYKDYSKSLLDAQVEINQGLNFITRGLNLRVMMNTTRYAFFELKRQYKPYFYGVESYDKKADSYTIRQLNAQDNPTEYLDYTEGGKDVNSTIYFEGALSYNRIFNKVHDISGMLVYQQREKLEANKGTLQKSLPYRNQGLSGRFTYAYDSRYLAELNFGYNGSERFYKKERYGFFPAAGLAWIISNEKFWENFSGTVNKLKLKGTYGLVGNDAIGDENDRFFYLSLMNMDDSGKGYRFGENLTIWKNGVTVNRYENNFITWEKSYKANVGFELGLFNAIEIQADYFTERRTNILMDRDLPYSMGLASKPRANVGEAKAGGIDASIDYNKIFHSGFWIQGRANFTYAHSEFTKYEEPKYNELYRYHVGQSLKQEYGLIAERLFIDEYDVMNSPRQSYGEYGAGDIKYYDSNNDGVINDDDKVPLGHPTVPEIVYGFGLSMGNKRFDFSMFFQGSARSSFWIDGSNTSPFQNDVALLKAYADDHWTEDNRNIYALWPRLSPVAMGNNTQMHNTWFMRDGSFLRLKTVEVGFMLPEKLLKKMRIESLRLYASGNNLLLFSGFDLWDIEMGGNGLGYPIQRVINLGLQLNF